MNKTYDVIIAGAGPVGLFLACELGLAGVSVLVLERDDSTRSPWKSKPLGVRGLNTLSVEAFYRRGLLDKIFDSSEERPTSLVKTDSFQFGGHFAGMMLDANKLELSRWKYRLPGPSLLPGPTDLERIGEVLSERARGLGVKILHGTSVTKVHQDSESVTVETDHQSFTGKWLAGCDGGRSIVRKSAGFEFVGTDPEFMGYVAVCDLANAEALQPGFNRTKAGMYIVGQLGQIYIMDFTGPAFDRSQTVTQEHFQNVLRRVAGIDIVVKSMPIVSTFTDRAMQATGYRQGRILLAGDSAHIHSPLGAQGLNTGIGDAMNLGWKLAATVKGLASEDLLDSYTKERHPVAAWVLEWTRAQVMTLKPNSFGEATARLIQDLIDTVDGTNLFIDRIWGLSQRYDLGDDHALAGCSAPDFEFIDGTRLGEKMTSGRGLLIDFTNNSALADLSGQWEAHLDYLRVKTKDDLGLRALLVRPDGTVAWAATDHIDSDRAKTAIERWFGAAIPVQS